MHDSEKNHSSIEKEAYAIVESIRRWNHLLLAKSFKVITDQRSVSFMFDQKHSSKIKNDKIARWRLELMPFKFEILYRPGSQNAPADALSRPPKTKTKINPSRHRKPKVPKKVLHVSNMIPSVLSRATALHIEYSHPGVTRFWSLLKKLNIPVTLEEVRTLCRNCPVCARIKPSFHKISPNHLISALSPWDRLSMDFKGPLSQTSNGNRFLLIVVDEFSRFPFAFPCKDISSTTVIKCLESLFSVFGPPKYLHSDRGTSFVSSEVKSYLFSKGIASSHSTPYHPVGNSQCERYVGIVWKTITLEIDQLKIGINQWDTVLDRSLHSIRSLISTATNATPHERLFSFARSQFVTNHFTFEVDKFMYLKKFVRNKSEPLVERVEVVNRNPNYTEILHGNGRFDRVSNNDLSPCPDMPPVTNELPVPIVTDLPPSLPPDPDLTMSPPLPPSPESPSLLPERSPSSPSSPAPSFPTSPAPATPVLRRSTRICRPPDRLDL